jgi:membrane-associated phospholipid phosphatase
VPGLTPLGDAGREVTSFPSVHAAIAGAASTILIELFPDEPAEALDELAGEAAASRLVAGAAYRSDVEVGLALGRAIGARAVVRAREDGADAVWNGAHPTAEGAWQPTPPAFVVAPLEPQAGTWQTWVIENGAAARPAPFPRWDSPAWRAELEAVQRAVANRTPEQEAAVHFWAGDPGTVTPGGLWIEIARELIMRDGLDLPRAADVLALTSVAIADAFVCCWDAKYAYWSARPITADPTLNVLITTPPFPSYTSGHSTVSAAAATVLGHLFPADAERLVARAVEAKESRLWAGIHFPLDNEIGAAMGGLVGRLVAAFAPPTDTTLRHKQGDR